MGAFDTTEVLEFWLNEIGEDGWYKGGDEIDHACKTFVGAWEELTSMGIDGIARDAKTELAALIVLDQLSRNMFRGEGKAFQADPLSRAVARRAIAANRDLEIGQPERQFFYLPLEHSEEMADQEWSVALTASRLDSDETALHARAHRAIIAQYGRFPFRNEVLGRISTEAEQAFLDDGGYGAVVRKLRL